MQYPAISATVPLTISHKVFVAYLAALLVQEYAIYAKHSGIPEIKTVLGGFVIQRFFGTWTLVTKSFGLVCPASNAHGLRLTLLDPRRRFRHVVG